MKSKISVILIVLLTSALFAQSDIKVISSSRNSLTIEYTPDYSDSSFQSIDNQNYFNAGLVNGFYRNQGDFGMPAVPVRLINIGVPAEFGNTIQVISSSYKEISGKIIPVPYPENDKGINNPAYKISENYYSQKPSEDLVTFGDYGLTRSVPTQSLVLLPVKFYPGQNRILLYTKIIFRINFSSLQTFSSKPASDLLNGALINYDAAKNWTVKNNSLKKGIMNSVLATGKWIRFEAPEEGIYKITKSMLISFGLDANTIDPRTIKIYNNGGKVLPENPADPRPSDLQENAIIVVGENDGHFDDGDYILFYGRGNNFWDYDKQSKSIKRYFHPYSDKNYYWITAGGSTGKRIQNQASLNSSSAYIQNQTKAFASWEEDKKNIGQTGRQYFGDAYTKSNPSITYTNKLDGRLNSVPITYKFRFADASSENIGLQLSENNNQIFSTYLSGYGSAEYYKGTAYSYSTSYAGTLPGDRSVLKFTMTPGTQTSTGYLDYFEIYYDRDLAAAGDNLLFFSKDTSAVIEYHLSGFTSSNIMVFNVTDYSNVKLISSPNVLSGGDFYFQANENSGSVSKYIAEANANFKTPVNPEVIPNSNIHGITGGAKFIIITAKDFDPAADRLKTYRETQSRIKLSTIVINIGDIYNEFSDGMVDVTAIRDFLKYAYDNWQVKPEYVLFLGKGTYDYKNVEGFNNNFIPPYETTESLAEIQSYCTDDYYVKVSGNDNFVDLASGRITVQNLQEANDVVDKIIYYETGSQKGPWRNLITLVADDGFTGLDHKPDPAQHTQPSEYLANTIIPVSYDLKKIYMAAYPEIFTSSGYTMPTVNKAIIDAINEGTLILNFIGHGSPSQWTQEDVFDITNSFSQLHNDKYFFLTAATCDFGYYDKPDLTSGAEGLLFMKNAGAIGSFTASRLVYSSLNHALMYQFFSDLLKSKKDTLNLSIPVGKAIFITKQIYNGVNDQKYHIIGDPTLRLLTPEYVAEFDSINGNKINSASADVQIKALSNTRIFGSVVRPDSTEWSDFNGEGILTVFDSKRTVPLPQLGNYPMTVQGGVIFRGRVSITNGKFSTDFVVPKDISYENKNGKAIIYFFGNNVDGLGYTNKVIVGGTDTTTVNDGKGPTIEIFFDNTNYKNAALVNSNSKLLVKLSDETGLNTTGTGVGHKFVGILNDQANDPIDFTNYFTSDLNSNGKSGEINYPFTNLASGEYKLEVKAWDVFNNFSGVQTYFSVVGDSQLVVRDVYNYPNPFANKTTFTFQQNLNKLLDVRIKIYTVAGRLIREIEKNNVNEKFVRVDWDGRDQDGSPIANGTYLYKILVHTTDGTYNKSVLGKLAVIR